MAYFEGAKKGELKQLNESLNSKNPQDKKAALKKVIAQMTVGKDLSELFQSVIKCLQFNDLEMKKLVYLYVINYSRTKPDDAIMSINLFRRDALNKVNPMLRALAVRTMSCLRVPKLNQYLVQPLKQALNDSDPYVRKTAVLSVPKVYQISMNDPQTNNLVEILKNLLQNQPNGLVLANCIASLNEISLISGKQLIKIDSGILSRLLVALNQCIQWGQVFILDFLTTYTPKDSKQAQMVIDRVLPRLSHINPAVVFGSIKLMIRYLDFLQNEDLIKNLCKKIGPSLVSLITMNQSQIQYVLLKNIQYIIQKRPIILQNQIKCFFCKFTQPYYIKNQKIQILIRIVNYKNYEPVLNQLKQYVNEGDPDFVRRSIKAVGKIAVRFEKSIDKCLQILSKQIKQIKDVAQHASHIVNQLLTAIQNILRKYPSKFNYDDMFKDLVELLEFATETDAKQASAWILGQYAQQIYKGAIKTFNRWIDTFVNQQRAVQLQILTSAVKVFIKYPDECEALISNLLTVATEKITNPDVRDRAYIYWRMLSTDTDKTKNVLFGYRPQIKEDDILLEEKFLNCMIKNMGYVSSVYQKRPEDLFQKSLAQRRNIKGQEDDVEQTTAPQEKKSQIRIKKEKSKEEQKQKSTQKNQPKIEQKPKSIIKNNESPPKKPEPVVVQKKTEEVDLLDLL